VGNIINTVWQRWKPFFKRGPSQLQSMLATRGITSKRALLLAPVLLALTFIAVTDPSSQAISKAIRKKISAALKDPLALFAQRSPGGRTHAAHLTKTKTGPHERLLSTVRDRPSPPGVASPLLDTPPAILDIPPGAFALVPFPTIDNIPELPPINPPGFTPFIPTGFPGGPPGGPSTPPGSPPPENPPGSPPVSPPVSPPSNPPTTVVIPEPATWTMMSLGLLAVALSARRRVRKQRR
jgi:hypothetical protein